MAIFGHDTIGADWYNCTSGGMRRGAIAFSPAEDGVLDSISVYGKAGAGDITIRAALYDDDDDSFVGATFHSASFGQVYAWHTMNADGVVNVLAAKTYQLVFEQSGNHYVKHDDGSPAIDAFDYETYGGPWPDPANWTNGDNRKYSVYATYTPGGAEVELSGTIEAQSGMSGALKVERKLSGTIEAQSGLSGELHVDRKLAGVIAAHSGMSGSLSVVRKLAGTIAAHSGMSGSLTVEGEEPPVKRGTFASLTSDNWWLK